MTMFPTPFTGGSNDPNRQWRDERSPDGTWPKALRYGVVLTLVAAVLMLVSGLFILQYANLDDAPLDIAQTFQTNKWVVGIGNIVLALFMTVAASYLRRGSRVARRWLSVLLFLAGGLNLAGFVVSVAGLAAIVIIAFVAFAAMFLYRPAANEFIRERN